MVFGRLSCLCWYHYISYFLFFVSSPGSRGASFRSVLEPLSKRGNFRRLTAGFNYSSSYGIVLVGGIKKPNLIRFYLFLTGAPFGSRLSFEFGFIIVG